METDDQKLEQEMAEGRARREVLLYLLRMDEEVQQVICGMARMVAYQIVDEAHAKWLGDIERLLERKLPKPPVKFVAPTEEELKRKQEDFKEEEVKRGIREMDEAAVKRRKEGESTHNTRSDS